MAIDWHVYMEPDSIKVQPGMTLEFYQTGSRFCGYLRVLRPGRKERQYNIGGGSATLMSHCYTVDDLSRFTMSNNVGLLMQMGLTDLVLALSINETPKRVLYNESPSTHPQW